MAAPAGATRSWWPRTCGRHVPPRREGCNPRDFPDAVTMGAHEGRRPAALLRMRSEEHTSELQSQSNLVCRLLLEKKKIRIDHNQTVRNTCNTRSTGVIAYALWLWFV